MGLNPWEKQFCFKFTDTGLLNPPFPLLTKNLYQKLSYKGGIEITSQKTKIVVPMSVLRKIDKISRPIQKIFWRYIFEGGRYYFDFFCLKLCIGIINGHDRQFPVSINLSIRRPTLFNFSVSAGFWRKKSQSYTSNLNNLPNIFIFFCIYPTHQPQLRTYTYHLLSASLFKQAQNVKDVCSGRLSTSLIHYSRVFWRTHTSYLYR